MTRPQRAKKMNVIRFLASAACAKGWYAVALSTCLLAGPLSAPEPVYSVKTVPPDLGPTGCPWPELSGRRLLDRPLGSISFSNAALWQVARDLVHEYGVPISLIEADPKTRVTLAMPSCSLQQLLDHIVSATADYRYGFVGSHLLLYSKDPKWQTRIDNLSPISGARVMVGGELMVRLRHLAPVLGHFRQAGYRGNPDAFILQDEVQVSGPATVIELLTQVLGERPSAVFALSAVGQPIPPSLWLDTVPIVQEIEVTAPTTRLRQGEEVQVKVSGVLRDGKRKDLTAASCGTHYWVIEKTIQVSRDGLVAAVSPGMGWVVVSYENLGQSIGLEVVPPSRRRPANDHW
jgi:hypothetical protein